MQVLFNLLGNAQQALSRPAQGGRSCCGRAPSRKRPAVCHGRRRRRRPGVPEAFIDRMFEPFFTTREEGTGYGLYLAAEILKEQSGRLTVRNNPAGRGDVHDLVSGRRNGPRSSIARHRAR